MRVLQCSGVGTALPLGRAVEREAEAARFYQTDLMLRYFFATLSPAPQLEECTGCAKNFVDPDCPVHGEWQNHGHKIALGKQKPGQTSGTAAKGAQGGRGN